MLNDVFLLEIVDNIEIQFLERGTNRKSIFLSITNFQICIETYLFKCILITKITDIAVFQLFGIEIVVNIFLEFELAVFGKILFNFVECGNIETVDGEFDTFVYLYLIILEKFPFCNIAIFSNFLCSNIRVMDNLGKQ